MNLQYTSIVYPPGYKHRNLTLMDIYHAVSRYVNIPDYTGKCRKKEQVYARHLFCYLSRELTNASWKTIASHIGDRDHTTAINSRNTLRDLYDTESNVRDDVENIKKLINIDRSK